MRKYRYTALIALLGGALASEAFADSKSETLAEIESLKAEIASLESQNSGLVNLQKNIENLRAEGEEKKAEILKLEQEVSELNYLYSIYKSAYRVVPKIASGTPMGSISLPNGAVVENAVFSGTARGGIQVATGGGPATVPVEQIPVAHADKFNLPGEISVPQTSLQAVAAMRPNEILGAVSSGSQPVASAGSEPKASENTSGESTPTISQDRADSYKAKMARNQQRWDKIEELKSESKRVHKEVRRVSSARTEAKKNFALQRIKPDRNKVESVIGGFDREIEKLEAREQEIMKEIRDVRRSLE